MKLLRSIISGIAAAHLLVSSAISPALASQNNLFSPTVGTVSGLQLTNNYNNAIDSLNTLNSGTSSPTNQLSASPSLGNNWLNSTSSPYPISVYDGAQWVKRGWLDSTNHLFITLLGGGTASILSAATTDLCGSGLSTPQAFITITGSTTITSFGSNCPVGTEKIITFAGALTLTWNATSMILPGAANIPTAAGDTARASYLGSGNWQVTQYQPANGGAVVNAAVDVGTAVLTFAVAVPSAKYLLSYGQAVSRTTYASLLANVTIVQSVTRTNGSPTLTGFSDTTQIGAGAAIEGAGIPAATTISSCTSTTCTMSANASSSGTANVTVFPYGNGDGSTTFNLPNCQGVALYGRDNMSGSPRGKLTTTYAGANPDALGVTIGAQNHTMQLGELVSHSHTITDQQHNHTFDFQTVGVTSGGTGVSNLQAGGNTKTITSSFTGITGTNATGSGNPFSIVPPGLMINCMIRVLAQLSPPDQRPANDNLAIRRDFVDAA
jgi:microcystin-dependent protein